MDGDKLLTIKQAAEALDVTPMTVRRHLVAGDLAYERPGREYLIWESELNRFKANRRPIGRPRKRPVEYRIRVGEHALRVAEE